jgi:hypothetical protein
MSVARKPSMPAATTAEIGRWSVLANCLTISCPAASGHLERQIELATAAGARPFEAIAGAPAARYGARVTFTAPPTARRQMAVAFGMEHHPWGLPSWVGVRVSPTGLVRLKPYHRLTQLDDRFPMPDGMAADLYPVMAALDGNATEVYLRAREIRPWDSFVAGCLAPIGGGVYPFAPRPRPAAHAHCVSLKWERGVLAAISLYADHRALPDDPTTGLQWAAGLDPDDARSYETALAGVRSLGRLRRGAWHAMLAWTIEANGQWHRAVSLRVP